MNKVIYESKNKKSNNLLTNELSMYIWKHPRIRDVELSIAAIKENIINKNHK